jgi:hypothetical protein
MFQRNISTPSSALNSKPQREASGKMLLISLLSTCVDFFPVLLIDPEDGSDMFLQNIGLPLNYLALPPRSPYRSPPSLFAVLLAIIIGG